MGSILTEITRKIEFDAGHRVYGHESKCAHLHGHRYVAEITVTADELDSLGRVIDFSVVKNLVGGWIDDTWDHNLLLNDQDPLFDLICQNEKENGRIPFFFSNENPTAENIARVLFEQAHWMLITHSIRVTRIRIYETPNCWADYCGT